MEKPSKAQNVVQEPQGPSVSLGTMGFIMEQDGKDNRQFRKAVVAAALLHVLAFVITWPTIAMPEAEETEQIVARIHVYEIIPPEPPPPMEMPMVPRTETVPIPDPTPDEPEPLREHIEMPEIIPEGVVTGPWVPPPPPLQEVSDVVTVGVDITAPKVIKRIQPEYTRAAVLAKLEGAVILKLVIDTQGNVEEVTVLRDMPLGLTDEAVKATKQWKFEPSTVRGKPVSVIYNLTIYFHLQ